MESLLFPSPYFACKLGGLKSSHLASYHGKPTIKIILRRPLGSIRTRKLMVKGPTLYSQSTISALSLCTRRNEVGKEPVSGGGDDQ